MILIAGEVYEPVEAGSYTIEYDLYMQQVLDASGLTSLFGSITEDSSPEEKQRQAEEAIRRVVSSGHLPTLLAGLVRPKGERWSAPWAQRTTELFQAPMGAQDRKLLLEVFTAGLAAFFRDGPRSWVTFP